MNKRLLYLRRQVLHLTQEEFGKALGVARSTIASIELGNITITERNIDAICSVYNVNREWLVNGSGEVFRDLSDDERLIDFIGDVVRDDDSLRKRFLIALTKLSEEDWTIIEGVLDKLK